MLKRCNKIRAQESELMQILTNVTIKQLTPNEIRAQESELMQILTNVTIKQLTPNDGML
jgi:hypothetical protein